MKLISRRARSRMICALLDQVPMPQWRLLRSPECAGEKVGQRGCATVLSEQRIFHIPDALTGASLSHDMSRKRTSRDNYGSNVPCSRLRASVASWFTFRPPQIGQRMDLRTHARPAQSAQDVLNGDEHARRASEPRGAMIDPILAPTSHRGTSAFAPVASRKPRHHGGGPQNTLAFA